MTPRLPRERFQNVHSITLCNSCCKRATCLSTGSDAVGPPSTAKWPTGPQLLSAEPVEEQGEDGVMAGTRTAGVPLSAPLRRRTPENLGISSQNSWKPGNFFWEHRAIFCSSEAPVGAGHQKDQARLGASNFQPHPHSLEKIEELKMGLINDYAFMRKPPHSFDVQKLLRLIRSHLFIFAFISNILGGRSWGSWCDVCRRVFCLCSPLGYL